MSTLRGQPHTTQPPPANPHTAQPPPAAQPSPLPPGPKWPAIMQIALMWARPASSMLRLRRFGTRATISLPFQPPVIVLSDPADIREVLMADPTVLHPGEGARVLEPILGRNSVILLDEDAHMEQRRLLLPAFHGERMQRLAAVMTELTEAEVATWPTDTPTALHGPLQRLTLEIILQTVFGLERGARLDDLRAQLGAVLAFSEHPLSILPLAHRHWRWFPQMRRFHRLRRGVDELVFAEIRERRAALAAGADAGSDILSMLLAARHEDGTEMSREEIRDELMTALVAGHETTASALAWAFMHLAGEPRVTAELTAELDAGGGDAYLIATIQEILRLRPVVPMLEPRHTMAPVRIGAHDYPAGVELLVSAFLVHHDPAIYPEPFAFRPERFLGATPGTYTWLPFGGGRRRCLGAAFAQLEMKIVLAAVLGRFALQATSDRPETTARRSVTFSPRGGATVILHHREPIGYDSANGHRQSVRQVPAPAPGAGDPAGGR